MDKARATEILCGLADGVNPLTGELLPDNCVCNQAEIVRAFHCIINELNAKKPKQQRPAPENAGKPWSKENDQQLLQMVENGSSIKDICAYFKRTNGAITSRLGHLGKMN